MKKGALLFLGILCCAAGLATGQIVDFEDLQPGISYNVGDVFMTGGVDVIVEPFVSGGTVWGYGHRVEVVAARDNPLQTGNAAYIDPANLRFDFGYPLDGLTLRFGEWGPGELNFEINGDFHEIGYFQDVHNKVIGGVRVLVVGGGHNQTGILELEPVYEPIYTFAIGGFEVFIDDVVPTVLGAFTIYYSNFNDYTVYRYRDGSGISGVHTRTSDLINYFEFAPWNTDQLYNSTRSGVYSVDLAGASPSKTLVYTHTVNGVDEQIRCLGFDSYGNLYLSDLDRLGASQGRIWRVANTYGGPASATLLWTVTSADTGWSHWNGHFTIGPEGTIYISGGNNEPSSIYSINFPGNVLVSEFSDAAGSVCGMAFGPDGLLYYADPGRFANPTAGAIYQLDLSTGTKTLVLHTGSNISDVGFREIEAPSAPPALTPWVMLYGIGSTRIDQIHLAPGHEGLIDYTDGISGRTMTDAPFGGRLGIQINASSDIPTTGSGGICYYRVQYKHESWADWKNVTEPLCARYVSQLPGKLPTFPTLTLGPLSVSGKNVYRFLPHNSDLPSLVALKPGEQVSWPKKPFPGEEYEGFLNTVGLGLAPGLYYVRMEVYDKNGVLTPGGAYDFLIPKGAAASTSPSATGSTYSFPLRIDNRACSAIVDPPAIAGTRADVCGFLRYQHTGDTVQLAWHALQPDQYAVYSLSVIRGAMSILGYSDDISSSEHNGDGLGNFFETYPVLDLLSMKLPPRASCNEAAFSANLHVLAKATTGNGYRISGYDAYDVFALALAPK